MSRKQKLVWFAAAAVCLVLVPVTLASYDGASGPPPPPAPPLAAVFKGRPHHASASGSGVHSSTLPRPRGSSVRIGAATLLVGDDVRPVPKSFLGLSIEYWGLPLFESQAAPVTKILSMLHVRGDGPLILRVGGDSADRSFWDPGLRRMPTWVFRLIPEWLRLTRGFLRTAHVRLILDLNLVTASPLRAAAWAQAAETQLPSGSIAGFEIGNEPDIYDRPYWLATIARVGQGTAVLPPAISPSNYVHDFRAYAAALHRFAPRVPLLGPAVANPHRSLNWIAELVRGARGELKYVTAHRYPYSACLGKASAASPSVARLLSEHASAGNAQSISPAVVLAHRAGLPFRMTEANSVTCGGRVGVSNTFATALWAPDALFELLRIGVDGVNIHDRPDAINAALVPNNLGVRARPLAYGLILFVRTLGPRGQLAAARLTEAPGLHLKAWAVRVNSGLHVLLINKGVEPGNVTLRVPGAASAHVQRLLAPSPTVTKGVTLDGQTLGDDGTWQGRRSTETIAPGPNGYAVHVPPMSAALVSIR